MANPYASTSMYFDTPVIQNQYLGVTKMQIFGGSLHNAIQINCKILYLILLQEQQFTYHKSLRLKQY